MPTAVDLRDRFRGTLQHIWVIQARLVPVVGLGKTIGYAFGFGGPFLERFNQQEFDRYRYICAGDMEVFARSLILLAESDFRLE